MAQNTFRQPDRGGAPKKPRRTFWLTSWLNDWLNQFDHRFGKDNPWFVSRIDRILWVTLLLIVYIGLNHNAERLVRRIQRTKTQVDELRSQFTVLQADYNRSGRQSELYKRVSALGLTDSSLTPPYKIVVKADEY